LCSGTLEDYFNSKYDGPRFVSDWEILRQITKGLEHLHKLEIVHRDIKPTNILIGGNDVNNKPVMKLADFSVSKALQTDRKDFTNTNVTNPSGTKGWIYATRSLRIRQIRLGCIFAYTLSEGNKHPFGEDPDKRVVRIKDKKSTLLTQKDLRKPYSKDGFTLEMIHSMLMMDPSMRPTITSIRRSIFFLFDPVSIIVNETL